MTSQIEIDEITAYWELEGSPVQVLEAETRVYLYHFIQSDAMMPPHTTLLFHRALEAAVRLERAIGPKMLPPPKPFLPASISACVLFRDARLASLAVNWASERSWNKTPTTIRDAVSAWTRDRDLDGVHFARDPQTRVAIFCPRFCLKVLPATAH